MTTHTQKIPGYVLDAFQSVNRYGSCNLQDADCVLKTMYEFKHYSAVSFLGKFQEGSLKLVVDKAKYLKVFLQLYPISAIRLSGEIIKQAGSSQAG